MSQKRLLLTTGEAQIKNKTLSISPFHCRQVHQKATIAGWLDWDRSYCDRGNTVTIDLVVGDGCPGPHPAPVSQGKQVGTVQHISLERRSRVIEVKVVHKSDMKDAAARSAVDTVLGW